MPIQLRDLENASYRYPLTRLRTLLEAQAAKQSTAFLSHSHKDADLAKGLQVLLKDKGWDVYIDWEDTAMPDRPTRETAEKIQKKIRDSDWFLFLATPNSTASRWCPWEIGYADGKKALDTILIIPTTDDQGNFYGNEYLQLYRRIDIGNLTWQNVPRDVFAVFQPNEDRGMLIGMLK